MMELLRIKYEKSSCSGNKFTLYARKYERSATGMAMADISVNTIT